jgi:hypothetical protein
LVVSLDMLGRTAITAPPGWTRVRSDTQGRALTKSTYVRVVTGTEPLSYEWLFDEPIEVGLSFAVVRGIDPTAPFVATGHSGARGSSIIAPSVTVSRAGSLVLGFYSVATSGTVTPPSGMSEATEVAAAVTSEISFSLREETGETGTQVAVASEADRNVGQLLVLAPPGAP